MLELKWVVEEPCALPCLCCEEKIYTKTYRLYIDDLPSETVVCLPCYSEAVNG